MICRLLLCLLLGGTFGLPMDLFEEPSRGPTLALFSPVGDPEDLDSLSESEIQPQPREDPENSGLLASEMQPQPRNSSISFILMAPTDRAENHKSYTVSPAEYSLRSENYPNNYPHSTSWSITVRGTSNQVISIYCLSFDIEYSSGCTKDYLMVNGIRYCGSKGPRVYSQKLDAVMVTDSSISKSGFHCVVAVPAPAPSSCCGYVNRATRIVGGHETEVREYPWHAAVIYNGWYTCGGSVINDRYVLTAAHCTSGRSSSGFDVYLARHRQTSGGEHYDVSRVISHPSYRRPYSYSNDVALLKLTRTISFANNRIAPACLASALIFPGADVIATGWGATSSGGSTSSVLLEVTVRTMLNSQCSGRYSTISDDMLCAAVDGGGKDACQGDSGGPLITKLDGNRYQQVGVVSWGYGCASSYYPGVYARVTSVYDWIKSNTADANLC